MPFSSLSIGESALFQKKKLSGVPHLKCFFSFLQDTNLDIFLLK